ncbi:hypothetical protein P3T35_000473 [Kitasatospora sp. GP30]|uniref:hypothetical protein n=1 Tax=Kitasatospora sp. GP30 TaxID=3035084 RepID=UPI000C702FAF|nr:hypothetical protein [Kitasatospora sp. GP30]MDH6138496.1 hypothetical protein [Kitasatospora sp. GP30]
MLTFGTYNLWNLDLPRTAVQKERYGLLVEVIRSLDVDVLAVQEILGDTPRSAEAVLRRLADDTGMDCAAVRPYAYDSAPIPALASSQHTFHTALMWRQGIEPVTGGWRAYHGGPDFWHSMATVILDVGAARPVKFCSFHGDPFIPQRRLWENYRVRSVFRTGEAGMIGADWNQISADRRPDGSFYDPDPYTAQDHDDLLYQVKWNPDPDATPVADRDPAEVLRWRGTLTDTAAALDVSWEPSCGHMPDNWGERRIDTVRVTRHLLPSLRAHRTVRTPATLAASDHLPALVDFEPVAITHLGEQR